MPRNSLTYQIARDCRGSLMVEMALFVPVIMFLLLGGVTLVHVVQLSRASDRAAAVLADDLAGKAMYAEVDFDTALIAASTLINTGGFDVAPWLSVTAVELHPTNGISTLWSRTRHSNGADCTGAGPVHTAPTGTETGAGVGYLLQVDLCATPGEGFFLLNALSVLDFSVHARASVPVRRPALRGFE